MNRRKIIGQNVCRLRTKAGLTQTQLADFVQLSKRYIQKIEHGEANITVEVIERLAKFLRCGWDNILGDLKQPSSVIHLKK